MELSGSVVGIVGSIFESLGFVPYTTEIGAKILYYLPTVVSAFFALCISIVVVRIILKVI